MNDNTAPVWRRRQRRRRSRRALNGGERPPTVETDTEIPDDYQTAQDGERNGQA
jgi:hypothetical protein